MGRSGLVAGVDTLVAVVVLDVTTVLMEVTVDPFESVVTTVSEDVIMITLVVGAGGTVEVNEDVKVDP